MAPGLVFEYFRGGGEICLDQSIEVTGSVKDAGLPIIGWFGIGVGPAVGITVDIFADSRKITSVKTDGSGRFSALIRGYDLGAGTWKLKAKAYGAVFGESYESSEASVLVLNKTCGASIKGGSADIGSEIMKYIPIIAIAGAGFAGGYLLYRMKRRK
jgi:hypothetical protein